MTTLVETTIAAQRTHQFKLLSAEDDVPDDGDDHEHHSNDNQPITMVHDVLTPITRRPSNARDVLYAVFFLLQFVVVCLLSLMERESVRDSITAYGNAGSFSSMFMLVILLASLGGGGVVFVLANDSIRESLLNHGILLSVSFQVCLGNIVLLTKSRFSWIGVIILLMALFDSRRMKEARENISFTSALLQLVIDVCEPYGISLCIACFAIVAAQTCALLWWGVLFVGLISGASLHSGYAELLMFVMGFSLYWITQFFHAFMSFVVGGCVLWHFLQSPAIDDHPETASSDPTGILASSSSSSSSSSIPTAGEDPSNRVMFTMSLGLSTNFGTIAKGALMMPIAETILALNAYHSEGRGYFSRCCGYVKPFAPQATQNCRLAMTFAAIYGKTYATSAADVVNAHSEVLDIALADITSFSVGAIAKELSIVLSVLFGLAADRREGQDWPMFFFVSFMLGYCSFSLSLHVFSAAVDAIIIAYAVRPDQLRRANSIVFLRFLRTTESELR